MHNRGMATVLGAVLVGLVACKRDEAAAPTPAPQPAAPPVQAFPTDRFPAALLGPFYKSLVRGDPTNSESYRRADQYRTLAVGPHSLTYGEANGVDGERVYRQWPLTVTCQDAETCSFRSQLGCNGTLSVTATGLIVETTYTDFPDAEAILQTNCTSIQGAWTRGTPASVGGGGRVAAPRAPGGGSVPGGAQGAAVSPCQADCTGAQVRCVTRCTEGDQPCGADCTSTYLSCMSRCP